MTKVPFVSSLYTAVMRYCLTGVNFVEQLNFTAQNIKKNK